MPILAEITTALGSKKGRIAIVILVLILFIGYAPATIVAFKKGQASIILNVEVGNTVINPEPTIDDDPNDGLVQGVVSGFDEISWEINEKRITKSKNANDREPGFYCVKNANNFDSAEIFYREKISVGSKIELRYELKDDPNSNQEGEEPILIFVVSPNRIFRVFIPDKDRQRIGFEENHSGNRTHQTNKLPRPMDTSGQVDVQLTIDALAPNKASFTYSLNYLSAPDEDGERIATPESNSFVGKFPWPNPTGSGTEINLGIGTFNGTCFKPLHFRVSPPSA